MIDNSRCPVCGKTGIDDYLKKDVKCPCCGSDLSIYRVIEQIPEEGPKFNIWKPISTVALLAAVGLGVLYYTSSPTETTTSTDELTQLKDSIEVLNNRINQYKTIPVETVSEYKYVARHGDSYWSISQKFYGTGFRAKELVQQNGRTLSTPLLVGDTIIIK